MIKIYYHGRQLTLMCWTHYLVAELYQDIPITITGHNITCNMLLGLDVLMTHGVVIGLNEWCLKVKNMELKQEEVV